MSSWKKLRTNFRKAFRILLPSAEDIIDPETKKCHDSKAILCREIIVHCDTKGSKRMIKVQSEIIPGFVGVADYFPEKTCFHF